MSYCNTSKNLETAPRFICLSSLQ